MDKKSTATADQQQGLITAPTVSLPKGGGAIRGIDEKFQVNPATGTGAMSIPIFTSPGRQGFGPKLTLSYDSGSGNGPFGLGWSLSIPNITRKTTKGLPRYNDVDESDVFILSGAEDLVPLLVNSGGEWRPFIVARTVNGIAYQIRRYRPRIEGLFARIERWTNQATGESHWRSITRDNVTTLYGKTSASRIVDPQDPTRIFSWLMCESYDDKGNAILYRYKAEDAANIDLIQRNERNRTPLTRSTNRYLKRILYGNATPRQANEDLTARTDWLFEVIFDYGEHQLDAPTPAEQNTWPARQDAFSSYRATYEVRTYRLCRRVLMFHHFPTELGVADYLVRSTDFSYAEGPVATYLMAATQAGFVRQAGNAYLKKALPPVTFDYSRVPLQDGIQPSEVETLRVKLVDAESLQNLPAGLAGSQAQLVDLDGEGLSGILIEQPSAWYYKPNLGEGRFGPIQVVAEKPSLALRPNARQQLLDLAGDGQLDLAFFNRTTPGFYERSQEQSWAVFQPFTFYPTVDWDDRNVRFVDLTGDGLADILITEDQVFSWHLSLGEAGFGARQQTMVGSDEERGPQLVFADIRQSIFLADMSGDGLTDLVRIRNGEVCYWPNLGYGQFGPKVTMDNAPWMDRDDRFDQRRIRLADIDGSGVTDIIYLSGDGVHLYYNQSGNGWSAGDQLPFFPPVDNLAAIQVADLLGNGTACLVWSSPLPGNASSPMRYIDLMDGQKPHLLISVKNNLGAETRVRYAPSTRFYLADQAALTPWATRLPFPVHVVERTEIYDYVSRNRFVSRYAYHHGYFDGEEREFRGFGMVEQWDTEAFEDYVVGVKGFAGIQELAPELNQPPVTTRTWFHTGAYSDQGRILHQFRGEYYRQEQHTPEPILPTNLDDLELRESVRALKGLLLRQEVYSFDGSTQEQHPYYVRENNYEVRMIQPRSDQRYAVFLPVGSESVTLHYERNPTDPRIVHNLNLEIDQYGNPLKSTAVVYGRRIIDPSLPAKVTGDQQQRYIAYAEVDYTTDIDLENPTSVYRLRVPYASRSYEITGIAPMAGLFTLVELKGKIAGAAEIPYENLATGVTAQKRPLAQSRTLFLGNNLNPLLLGQWDWLGLVYQNYQLAFTPSVVNAHYAGKVTAADFTAAGYVHFAGDTTWWIPSGTAIYPANPANHFYLPIGTKDPLGTETVATFDQYDLLTERVQVRQATWNEITATNDYRVLGPVMMTDPNKNRSAVELDALGMVVKSAVMGKVGEGDTLADPTVRMEYEVFNWMNNQKPNFVHIFAREQHGAANPRWQESYVYSNGSGGVAMVKAQAHPGKALRANPDSTVTEVDANPRWVGDGRTILNNKGNPVKQYEPYFSTTYEYEDEKALREIGVTRILYYDPVGRNIRTLAPNGTFVKVEFDSWMQKVFDANDTVKVSQWYTDRGSPDPATQPEPVNNPERRAAWLAAKHADTPGIIHFDSLGRPIYAISDYGAGKTAAVRSESDLTGRFSTLYDQNQRAVASGFTGMSGAPISGESAEKGRRWTFPNVLGALVRTWDEHAREFRIEYDSLHRPVSTFVQEAGQAEILFSYVVYGDRHPNAQQLNLLGIAHQIFDQAGMVRMPELDFKGNPKSIELILAKDYKSNLNWNAVAGQSTYAAIQMAANPSLEIGEIFAASSTYDALNRPMRVTLPDNTVLVPTYNEANFLASLQAQIRGQGAFIDFLKNQDYDAKGQRQFAHYGNDLFTRYFYDPQTFRLTNLVTYKSGNDPAANALQNLRYTYDPVGNITRILDDAQQTYYFNNAVVKPESLYEYDAIYQLIRATGREQAGGGNDTIRQYTDLTFVPQLPHVNNAAAVRIYTEEYEYDLLGNVKVLRHRFQPQAGAGNGWTRHYRYAYEDQQTNRTNRLTSTSLPGDSDVGSYSATYTYDVYGNMTKMPHLAAMNWNFMDQLRQVDLGGGGMAYYVYSIGGQRIRKVVERQGGTRLERIYLGTVEIYRERQGNNALDMERLTLHISDNTGRIAQVDTKTKDNNNRDLANPLNMPLIRYQYSNHLGSAMLETEVNGVVISYEEYHPYGTSAYRSVKPGFDLSLKRYRFSGKERDDETGLYYFGARYYAPWLGRWTSSDPAGFVRGTNLFEYCSNNPSMFHDPNGMDHYVTIWKYQPGEYSRSERGIINNPQSDPSRVLEIFKAHGYKGGGPLEWRGDFGKHGGWVRTTPLNSDGQATTDSAGEGGGAAPTSSPAASSPLAPQESTEKPRSVTPTPRGDTPEAEHRTEPTPSEPELTPTPDAARQILQEGARPESTTGARPRGTLHLWSGAQGKADAQAAIRGRGSGWMMGDIEGAPTPEHAAGEQEFARARARAPGGQLTQAEFERIWGPRSASVVGRGAFAGHPVEAHGTPASTSIQVRYEWPARAIGGGVGGGLFFGTGMFTAISGGQDRNPAVAASLVLAGVGEATSGIIYGSGAILGSTEAMIIGAAGGTFFAGAGATIGFGVASARAFERGDTAGGVVNALGAVGGALLIASLFTPVGWVGLLGVGLVSLAAGFNLGRWLSH